MAEICFLIIAAFLCLVARVPGRVFSNVEHPEWVKMPLL